jgi:manganese-dependent inorganic pyrophosphatase
LEEKNTAIVAGEHEAAIVQWAFDSATVDGLADLGKRVSRKKQIVPPLDAYFVV